MIIGGITDTLIIHVIIESIAETEAGIGTIHADRIETEDIMDGITEDIK
jgi:hypothetical protein